MSDRLFLLFPSSEDHPVQWLHVEGTTGALTGGAIALEELAQLPHKRNAVVVVPGEAVTAMSAVIPAANRKRLLQAAPYAVEDQLIDDVESLHIAVHPNGEQTAIFATARQLMARWTDLLSAAGIEAAVLIPDYLMLPYEEGSWSVWIDTNRIVVRRGELAGFSLPVDSGSSLLAGLLRQDEASLAHLQIWAATDHLPSTLPVDPAGAELHRVEPDSLLNVAALAAPTVNLLQGAYDRRERMSKRIRPWIPAAAMLLVAFGVQMAIAGIDNVQLKRESEAVRQDMARIYRELYPDAKNVVNPKAQLDQKLAELSGGGPAGALAMLDRVGTRLKAHDKIEIRGISLRGNRMDLDLVASDLQTLDKLKQDLGNSSLDVVIQSANNRDNGIESRLQIEDRGA